MKKKLILLISLSTFVYSCATPTAMSPSKAVNEYNGTTATSSAMASPVASGSPSPTNVYASAAPSASASVVPMASAVPSMIPIKPDVAGANQSISQNLVDQKTKNNFFKNYEENAFVNTLIDRYSTFSADIDTASYTWVRKAILDNVFVDPAYVRTEEFINYFDYDYQKPAYGELFSINTEVINSNFNDSKIIRVGIQGKQIYDNERKNANVTFLIDVSGSMNQENRLELVKQSLEVLIKNLRATDKVSVVVFGTNARVLVENTDLQDKEKVLSLIRSLKPEGSTNTEEGLKLAFATAEKYFNADFSNKVLLCSDGVANVGDIDPAKLVTDVKKYADQNISLSTIGFGMGNYNDILLEKLAYSGGGQYAYVDSLKEAERVFSQNTVGILQIIAKDLKIQVNFNPQSVISYRLIGYEKRALPDTAFKDVTADASEVYSNQSVTALYEVKTNATLVDTTLASVSLNYKDVNKQNSTYEISKSISSNEIKTFDNATEDTKLAITVAQFAEILKNGYWSNTIKYTNVIENLNKITRRNDKINDFSNILSKISQKY